MSREDLDGHHALHAAVPGLVHRSHAAGPEAVQYLIVAYHEFFKLPRAHGRGLKGSQLPGGDQVPGERFPVSRREVRQTFRQFL